MKKLLIFFGLFISMIIWTGWIIGRSIKGLFILALILFPLLAESSTVYFVGQTATGSGLGVDVNNLMSVAVHNGKAADYFAGDDTIYLCDTITTGIVPPCSGSAGHQIVYRGDYPGHPCTLDGAGFVYNSKNYITARNMAFLGNVGSYSVVATAGTGLVASNLTFNVGCNYGMYFSGVTVAIDHITGTSATFLVRTEGACVVTVDSVTATNCSVWLNGNSVIASNITVNGGYIKGDLVTNEVFTGSNFSVTNGSSTCITLAGAVTGVTLNLSNINANTAGSTFNGLILTGTFTAGSILDGFDLTATNIGLWLSGAANLTVKNGKSYTNRNDGIYMDAACSAITIFRNTIYDNGRDGISWTGNSTGITVERNESYGNGTVDGVGSGDGITSHAGCTGTVITNYVHDNYNSGIAMVETSGGVIYNNTVVNNGRSGRVNEGVRGGFYCANTGGGWTVKNNIFVGNYPNEVRLGVGSAVYVTMDYNQYYHIGNNVTETNFASLDAGSTQITWAQYHTSPNTYETHSSYANPNFSVTYVPSNAQYGAYLGQTTDYNGNPFLADLYGRWTIGAIQQPYVINSAR